MNAVDDFEQYVAGRQRALLRLAWVLTGDWALAEDLVQTALVRAWPHWQRLEGGAGADAYVRRIMVNKSLDWRHRRWTGEVPTAELPDVVATGAGDAADVRQTLLTAVRGLPPRQRAIVALRFLDDLSEAQTAAVLGCSVGTVKNSAAKALAALRRHPALADFELEVNPT